MDKNKLIQDIIKSSGKSAYKISKDSGITQSTISDWINGVGKPNTSLIDVVYHSSKDDNEFLNNIKKFLKKD